MLAVGSQALGRDVEVEADSGVEGVGAPHQHIPGYGAPAPLKLLSSISNVAVSGGWSRYFRMGMRDIKKELALRDRDTTSE